MSRLASMDALKRAAGSARSLLGGGTSTKVEEFGKGSGKKGKRGSSRSLLGGKKEPRRKRNAADDLTDSQIQEFLGAFELFDKDNSGSSESQFGTRLGAPGRARTRAQHRPRCSCRSADPRRSRCLTLVFLRVDRTLLRVRCLQSRMTSLAMSCASWDRTRPSARSTP